MSGTITRSAPRADEPNVSDNALDTAADRIAQLVRGFMK